MSNQFKRFLSLVMAVLMVFSYVPFNAFATESGGDETTYPTYTVYFDPNGNAYEDVSIDYYCTNAGCAYDPVNDTPMTEGADGIWTAELALGCEHTDNYYIHFYTNNSGNVITLEVESEVHDTIADLTDGATYKAKAPEDSGDEEGGGSGEEDGGSGEEGGEDDGVIDTVEELKAALADASVTEINIGGDITTDEILTIDRAVTIYGNEYTVTGSAGKVFEVKNSADEVMQVAIYDLTIVNTAANGRCVDTRNDYIDLYLGGCTLTAENDNSQPLTIGGTEKASVEDFYGLAVSVMMENGTINAGDSGYGVIAFVPVAMDIQDSQINGYGCIYMKEGSAGSSVGTISYDGEMELNSRNIHNGESNNFGAIVLEDEEINVSLQEGTAVTNTVTGTAKQSTFALGENVSSENVYLQVNTELAAQLEEEGYDVNDDGFIIALPNSGEEGGGSGEEGGGSGEEDGGSGEEGGDGTYTVTIEECENGTVTADVTEAAEGATVTLTVTPATGYVLDTLTVTDADNEEVTVTNNSFTMPASDVAVYATFIKTIYYDNSVSQWEEVYIVPVGGWPEEYDVKMTEGENDIWYATYSMSAKIVFANKKGDFSGMFQAVAGKTYDYKPKVTVKFNSTANWETVYAIFQDDAGDMGGAVPMVKGEDGLWSCAVFGASPQVCFSAELPDSEVVASETCTGWLALEAGKTYVYPESDALTRPTATVSEIENEKLTFAMRFTADEVTEEQLEYFGSWYADFELTVNKDITLNANGGADGYLGGSYQQWQNGAWVYVPFEDVTMKKGETLKIMEYASELMGQPGLKYTYKEVYEVVKEFDCGMFLSEKFMAENPDVEITLELRMYNPEDESESYVIGETYIFTLAKTDYVAYNTTTKTLFTTVSGATAAAKAGETVILLQDVEEAFVPVYESTTLDLNGFELTATYVTCYGDLVDNSEDNSGVLKVSDASFMIREDNAQLPIKNADKGGYQFFEMLKYNEATVDVEGGAVKYCFQPFFEPAAHALLLKGSAASGVTVVVRLSWKVGDDVRTQDFVYGDEMVKKVVNSYSESAGKYGQMYTLTMNSIQNYTGLTYRAYVVTAPGVESAAPNGGSNSGSESGEDSNVTTDENNQVTQEVTIENEQASAVVPTGTLLEENTTQLTLTAEEMDGTTSNITLGSGEEMLSMNVHVEGVAADNTVPILITLTEVATKYLNQGNLSLYHVENGETVEMTRVMTLAEVDTHNEFYYDVATGTITMALATFSEVAVVADEANIWKGKYDYSWYSADKTSYTIYNADQLAAFGRIVGGMADDFARDSFADATVTLIADVNLGDAENSDANKIFHPIGYYYTDDKNADGTTGDYYSTVYSFEGTFDGNGHTIANFYQNTWEIKGDYDGNCYSDAMGLFGYVVNGTVKNLTVDHFSSDGEFTPTGVIAAYAVNSTFENIALTYCNPRVYNTGNGGIVGVGGDSSGDDADTEESKLIFKNITIDNTNKISALWGSWDVACGGLMGMFRGLGHVYMTNCHVAAQIDVYNDVCGNYQYYWYRYAGMMIGTNKNMTTDANGYTVPETSKFHAENCTVHFGEWNDYYYCELVANSLASYTHDHQFSRLTQVDSVDAEKMTVTVDGVTTAIPTSGRYNYVVVNGEASTENATCYHFVDGTVWKHEDAGYETTDVDGDGVVDSDLLKEDRQHYYLPFNQLFTGYGWGVKHIPLGEFDGVTILDREVADSVVKFAKADTAQESYVTGKTVTIGDLFKAATIADEKLTIKEENVQVTVSPVGDESTAGGTYTPNTTDWTQGTLTFSGLGQAEIIISDYYFCESTKLAITVTEPASVDKFDLVFENTDDYLYRVGNQNTVALGSLFEAIEGVEIGNVSIKVTDVEGNELSNCTYTAANTWTDGTLKFDSAFTGPVCVTIDDDAYANEKVLNLEVVTAKNITSVESATSNSVVLLNDVSGGFSVSGGHTFYGNGFTVTLPTTVQSSFSAGYVGYVYMSGGNLDNVKIEGPVYPEMYIYRDQAKDSTDGTKANYFYNSVLINGGNNTITNSYISGSRSAICIRGANGVIIDNTTLSGGAYANMHIAGANSVTLKDLTTVQTDVSDSYGKGNTAHGLGIAVESSTVDIYIEGALNQYNWLCEAQWDSIVPSSYQSSFPDFFGNDTYSKFWHYLNGGTDPYVNMTFIFSCNWDTSKIHDNRATVDYGTCDATIANVDGGIYSKVNTEGGNAVTDSNLADPGYASPGFDPVAPVFTFDNTANNDADDENDAADTYCVYDDASGILKIGVTGDSKTLDLSGVAVTKDGTTLTHTVYLNGTQISGNSVTIKAADGAKQTLTFKATTNGAGYDKDGNAIAGSIEYTWTVNVEIAVLAYPAPVWNMGGDYTFDTSNCYYAYYQTSQGYGEAVPIYEGVKVNYYNKSGTLVELDLSETTTLPTGSDNANANAFTYTLSDGSTLVMKFVSGWKSGATTHQFTAYNSKVYIYPQSLDNDNYVRAKTTNQDFNVKISYTFTDPNGQSTETVTMNWYNAAASNDSVSAVQWKKFDSTNGKEEPGCVTPDTLITLADGTQKRVDGLTYGDKVLVWDFFTGTYTEEDISILVNHGEDMYQVANLEFSDGTVLRLIADHGVFDYDANKYVYITVDNMQEYIGHRFVQQGTDGDYQIVELVKAYATEERTSAYSITSAHASNVFASGLLTVAPPDDFYNWIEMGDTLMYDVDQFNADVETYGLYTYEDFADYVTPEIYDAFNGAYLKIPVEKGQFTFAYILELIEMYGSYMPANS